MSRICSPNWMSRFFWNHLIKVLSSRAAWGLDTCVYRQYQKGSFMNGRCLFWVKPPSWAFGCQMIPFLAQHVWMSPVVPWDNEYFLQSPARCLVQLLVYRLVALEIHHCSLGFCYPPHQEATPHSPKLLPVVLYSTNRPPWHWPHSHLSCVNPHITHSWHISLHMFNPLLLCVPGTYPCIFFVLPVLAHPWVNTQWSSFMPSLLDFSAAVISPVVPYT